MMPGTAYPERVDADHQPDWPDVGRATAWPLPADQPPVAGRFAWLMRMVTPLGGATATIMVGLALCALGGGARRVGLVALIANLVSHAAVQVLKRVVARPRPHDRHGRPLALIDLPDPYSFPSGHAAAASAVATVVSWSYPWLGPVVLPLAAMVAASRVVLRVHHTGDVVAGALLGVAGVAAAEALIAWA